MWSDAPLRIAVWLASFLIAAQVRAGGDGVGSIVYDPTNHAETAVAAAESVKQTAQQLRGYLLQTKQYAAELRNLESLPREAIAAALRPYEQDAASVVQLLGELQSMSRDVDALRDAFDRRLKEAAQLRLAPTDYWSREAALATRLGGHYAAAAQADVRILRAVDDGFARVQALQRQIPAAVGTMQSMQTMNQHLNLLAGQNAELLALMARGAATRDETERQAAERRRADARAELDSLARENAAIDAMRERVRKSEHATGWGLLR